LQFDDAMLKSSCLFCEESAVYSHNHHLILACWTVT